MVWMSGGPTEQKHCWGVDGTGVRPTTKAAPAADGELYCWLYVCLVRVQLFLSAKNAPLLGESP